jgi:hypothetical protein
MVSSEVVVVVMVGVEVEDVVEDVVICIPVQPPHVPSQAELQLHIGKPVVSPSPIVLCTRLLITCKD